MAVRKVVPGSLTDAYKLRQGDFAPSLVGNQFTDPNAFFTLGNFNITSNFDGRVAQDFKLGEWSDYYNLNNLEITEAELQTMVSNNIYVRLNYDKTNINRYVYFGSFYKFLENTIQEIIVKWPASLSVTVNAISPNQIRPSGINTVLDYNYDTPTDTATFKTPTGGVNNPYNLDYTDNPFGQNNIPSQISEYVLSDENNNEYVIQNMTGKTTGDNYIYFKIRGKVFNGLSGTTFAQRKFYIKPVKAIRDKFFINLTDFQNLLLDRLTIPRYNFTINVPIKYDDGDIGFILKSFTWPTTDGDNLDISTFAYENYIEELFKIANLYDENKTDLVLRRFVSDSIIEYDTEGEGTSQTGMRVSKLLRVYGVEFDVVKKYIDGISFANVVTYNKKDNTSDSLIKIMAKTLGFDTLITTGNAFNLLENDEEGDDPQFSGYSRELSAKEIDIELWRRLVINAWWLFRSKGTRKVLEFFMKLFGINNCLVTMDERVYLAKDKLDLSEVRRQFNSLFGPAYFDINYNTFPFDDYGFPETPKDTDTFWFQNDGFWYNGGNIRTTGNNPHYGVYDFGQRYWDRFRCFVDGFQQTINVNKIEPLITNYFTEYNNGTFTPDSGGQAFSNYGQEVAPFFVNPNDNINVLSAGLVSFGHTDGPTNVRDSGNTHSLRITFQAGESELCADCPTDITFGPDGLIYVIDDNGKSVPHNIEECCDFYWAPNEIPCEGWVLERVLSAEGWESFITEDGTSTYYVKNEDCCYRFGLTPQTTADGIVCINDGTSPTSPSATVGTSVGEIGVPTNTSIPGFNLNMLETILTPSQIVDCSSGGVGGILTSVNNSACNTNSCPDSSYGQLIVNLGTTVNIIFEVFGGATALCCSYSALLDINNTIHLLDSPTYTNNTTTITLGPGTYDLKLSLMSYTCGSGYASITVEENITTIGGIDLFEPFNPAVGVNASETTQGQGGTIPPVDENFYYCWWCPPQTEISIIGTARDFLLNIGNSETQILTLAAQYGYNGHDPVEAQNFLYTLMNTYFSGGNNFYMVNGEILKNEECCKLRGGTWNPKTKLCEISVVVDDCLRENVIPFNGLAGMLIDDTQTVGIQNFTILEESCCTSLGYYYGGLTTFLTNVSGGTEYISPNFSTVEVLQANQTESGCFLCPREIKEILLADNTIGIADSSGNTLSDYCCTSLGYTYVQKDIFDPLSVSFCKKCSTTAIIVDSTGNIVTDTDGSILGESCCEALGYYFYSGDIWTTDNCYICPPVGNPAFWPISGTYSNNYLLNNINVNGTTYTVITDSNGAALNQKCCLYFGSQPGTPTVTYDLTIGCYQL